MSLLPNCEEVARLINQSRDSGRPLGSHARLHLWVCEACRRLKEQLALLSKSCSCEPKSNECLSEDAKKRLKKTLE